MEKSAVFTAGQQRGYCGRRRAAEREGEQFDQMMAVNVRGHFLMMKHAVPEMKRGRWGDRQCSPRPPPCAAAAYTALRKPGRHAHRSVALMHARDKVRANTVLPAYIDSTISRRRWRVGSPGGCTGSAARTARFGSLPKRLFLLSDQASYITGTESLIGGGALVTYPLQAARGSSGGDHRAAPCG